MAGANPRIEMFRQLMDKDQVGTHLITSEYPRDPNDAGHYLDGLSVIEPQDDLCSASIHWRSKSRLWVSVARLMLSWMMLYLQYGMQLSNKDVQFGIMVK